MHFGAEMNMTIWIWAHGHARIIDVSLRLQRFKFYKLFWKDAVKILMETSD